MIKIIALLMLISSVSVSAAEPTVKFLAHATYLCGDKGLVIKTAALAAKIGQDDGYKMTYGDNEPAKNGLPAFVTVQYGRSAPTSVNADWFSLTLTQHVESISLTYVNQAKKIESIGMSCQIVE